MTVKMGVDEEALFVAAQTGNHALAQTLLAKQVSPNVLNRHGKTALMSAVEKGDVLIAEAMLAAGGDPNLTNSHGNSALWIAVRKGKTALVKRLLEHGGDPNFAAKNDPEQGHTGQTLLMQAAGKSLPLVKLLHLSGADIHARSATGETALMNAIAGYNAPVAAYLLEHGANPNVVAKGGASALLFAAFKQDLALVDLLAQYGVVAKEAPGVLAYAVAQQDEPLISRLLDLGADLHSEDWAGNTPLMFACSRGDLKTLQRLVATGAEPDRPSSRGVTPLMIAAGCGALDCAEFLLLQGANPNACAKNGMTPLAFALLHSPNANQIGKRLLSAGADPEFAKEKGRISGRQEATLRQMLK